MQNGPRQQWEASQKSLAGRRTLFWDDASKAANGGQRTLLSRPYPKLPLSFSDRGEPNSPEYLAVEEAILGLNWELDSTTFESSCGRSSAARTDGMRELLAEQSGPEWQERPRWCGLGKPLPLHELLKGIAIADFAATMQTAGFRQSVSSGPRRQRSVPRLRPPSARFTRPSSTGSSVPSRPCTAGSSRPSSAGPPKCGPGEKTIIRAVSRSDGPLKVHGQAPTRPSGASRSEAGPKGRRIRQESDGLRTSPTGRPKSPGPRGSGARPVSARGAPKASPAAVPLASPRDSPPTASAARPALAAAAAAVAPPPPRLRPVSPSRSSACGPTPSPSRPGSAGARATPPPTSWWQSCGAAPQRR
ncbi:unnamed protein product [Polarella glacialis]|uniref:Uncharacterized protein n=1 Tax=Polarella glacialis TaxID=89957 RepID=A0A813EL81_POLGL|nr:unnamed protein product [Polarella glacialis]CAE8685188.1 unnamed protein product [Polarella glacialis]